MKRLALISGICLACSLAAAQSRYDVVIVGGTPGGITCAVSAAREGMSVLLLERTSHIGGLPANGLGATDITTRGATAGLFLDFVARNRQYYVDTYGADSQQVKDCSDGYHFEPSVAEKTFLGMLSEQKGITVLYNRQFDSDPANVTMRGKDVESIRILNRETAAVETYTGRVFIDATYEGDLAAATGIPYHLGRESRDEYGEPCSGRIFRHWGVQFGKGETAVWNGYPGKESEGTTYQGDNAIQAYNYRLCLTQDKSHLVKIPKPAGYNRDEYASLVEDVWTGRNTGIETAGLTEADYEANRAALKAGKRTQIPGDPWGMAKVTNMVKLPNGKTDANNQHMAFLSTDLPEENWPWPTASWEWRDRFAARLKAYTLGLLWFVQNDKELPSQFRKECRTWGLSSTEYTDNDHFPRQPSPSRPVSGRPYTPKASPPAITPWIPTPATSVNPGKCTWMASSDTKVCPIPFRSGLWFRRKWATCCSPCRFPAATSDSPRCGWSPAGWRSEKRPASPPRQPSGNRFRCSGFPSPTSSPDWWMKAPR